jgi:hypothetical protein
VAAAAVAVDAADATAAEAREQEGAPVLVEARAQALLIAALRLALAVGGALAAVGRGVDRGPAVGLVAFGAGLVLLSVYAGGRPQRAALRFGDPEPVPEDARVETRERALARATYPSTIGLTVLTAIALWPQPPLAAFLAGILAGLGVMALVGAARVTAWERAWKARLFIGVGSDRVFEVPR